MACKHFCLIKRSIIGVVALLALAFSACTSYQEEEVPMSFSVNREELSFTQNGESQSITVISGTKWDVTSMPSWISLRSIIRSGVSPYEWSVDFYSAANDGYDREGTIVFKSQNGSLVVSITQEGEKGKFVAVESISTSLSELIMMVGHVHALTVTISPSNATDKSVTWSSSNTTVATVTTSGVVTAKAVGSATIYVTATDGGKTANCSVIVSEVASDAVDLGLSVKWGAYNLGANKPEEYGDYYAWGETETKDVYNWSSYKWCNGSAYSLSKYCTDDAYGDVDSKVVLDKSDDVASVILGENWRIPTHEEWDELINSCAIVWGSRNGIKGVNVTSRINGKSIFLPAAGVMSNSGWSLYESNAYFWSSSLADRDSRWARSIFSSASEFYFYINTYQRCNGLSIRPVYDEDTSDSSTPIPDPIDLGISVKWASFNLGASKPEEYGDYYAWGETEPYYETGTAQSENPKWKEGKAAGYSWQVYKWCMGKENALTKYCSDSSYGYENFSDNKTVLDPEDDAAHVHLGGKWRMPTEAEMTELINQCTWEVTEMNGVIGARGTGPNGNSIFLPAAGYYVRYIFANSSWGYDHWGTYWSSSVSVSSRATSVNIYNDQNNCISKGNNYRYIGDSVRPVTD